MQVTAYPHSTFMPGPAPYPCERNGYVPMQCADARYNALRADYVAVTGIPAAYGHTTVLIRVLANPSASAVAINNSSKDHYC